MRVLGSLFFCISCVAYCQQGVLTVCEVLTNPGKYNGTVISVRGSWTSGGEVYYLRGNRCSFTSGSRPKADVIGIHLTPARMSHGLAGFDAKSEELALRALRIHKRSGAAGVAVVTATGRFESQTQPDQKGERTGLLGYGHLGMFPAQIVYLRLSDFAVVTEDGSR